MKKHIIALKNTKRNRSFVESEMVKNGEYGPIYVFMSTVLPVHSVMGTIDFPDGFPERLKLAKEIVAACTDNVKVPIDPLVIDKVNKTIKDYELSTTGNRPGLFKTMNNAIKNSLLAPFQTAADADAINSITILESGKFHVKGQAIHKENIFEGKSGVEKGTVDLKAPGGPQDKHHLHIWFHSLDNITFSMVAATNNASTILGGYKSGTIVYFRTQLSIKDELQEMSQTIEVAAK